MHDIDLRDRYLARLGVGIEPPSADALARLHRAHVERVPWETLWIQCGERWGTDPRTSASRIAATGRGGYCYHLNGAFSWLLAELGYAVTRGAGGVHGLDGPAVTDLGNHLVLTVGGLRTDAHPDGVWYVDVGLGDALHAPLPLTAADHASGPFTFRLGPAEVDGLDWCIRHRPRGAFVGMAWRSAPVGMEHFDTNHRHLSTDPESNFVRFLVLSRRDTTGADVLRGLAYLRAGDNTTHRTIESERELFELLGDVFGIDPAPIPAPVRRSVWDRADAAHRAFLDERAARDD